MLTKLALYALLISALVPASYLAYLAFMLFLFYASEASLSGGLILMLASIVGCLVGYIGLWVTVVGLHKSMHRTKIILLSSGVLGFLGFSFGMWGAGFWKSILSMRNLDDWYLWIWPLIVAIAFIVLLVVDFHKLKREAIPLSNS